jgi:predicted PhzF superfamily epimerase YddE/YHI9
VLRYAAFTDHGGGGNPAGVVLDAAGLDEAARLAIAARVGYSETAFAEAAGGAGQYRVRYFSPRAEVAFCGHATIAAAVAIAERDGPGLLHFDTLAGPVAVRTSPTPAGLTATLTSVPARTRPVQAAELEAALAALRWRGEDLDPRYPAHVAYAGNDHLILAVRDRARQAADAACLSAGWLRARKLPRCWASWFHAGWPRPASSSDRSILRHGAYGHGDRIGSRPYRWGCARCPRSSPSLSVMSSVDSACRNWLRAEGLGFGVWCRGAGPARLDASPADPGRRDAHVHIASAARPRLQMRSILKAPHFTLVGYRVRVTLHQDAPAFTERLVEVVDFEADPPVGVHGQPLPDGSRPRDRPGTGSSRSWTGHRYRPYDPGAGKEHQHAIHRLLLRVHPGRRRDLRS